MFKKESDRLHYRFEELGGHGYGAWKRRISVSMLTIDA